MNGAADKMSNLLGELLEMSRIGRVVNPPVAVTFKELVEESLRLVAGSIEDRGVKVRVSEEPVTLYGDHSRLVEIWQNLLENAVKFMGTSRLRRLRSDWNTTMAKQYFLCATTVSVSILNINRSCLTYLRK